MLAYEKEGVHSLEIGAVSPDVSGMLPKLTIAFDTSNQQTRQLRDSEQHPCSPVIISTRRHPLDRRCQLGPGIVYSPT